MKPKMPAEKSLTWNVWSSILITYMQISNVLAGSPPIITEHPLDILAAKGDPVTIRCGTSGENVEIIWYKDAEQVKVGNGHRLILPNGSLFLLKVNSGGTDSDAGTYYCVAKNEFGQARSQEANLRVAMLRDDFRVNPHAMQALIGNRATLECSPPKGFPEPVVTWKKDEKDLDTQDDEKYHQHPNGNLIIENIQRSDAGFYQCVAGNMVGQRVSKPARLSVYEKPKFLAEPKDIVAEVNSSVVFDCRVVGEPMPSISWRKKDDQMPINRAYVAKDSRGLKIDRIQPEDAGEYICYAKNAVGSIETSAILRINSSPIFTKIPENVRLNAGNSAYFECEATGQPPPAIFWSKEGDQSFTFFSGLISSDGRTQVTKENRLIIANIRTFDQGNYVCAAVNSAGSTLTKASLTVINSAVQVNPPPVIQYGHQNQTLMLKDIAILPCQATGRILPQITWLKNGHSLDFDDMDLKKRYRQLSMGTLQITDLRKEDTGIFTCRAKNEDGEAWWTASLAVEEHTNLETIFHRMPDATALPSSPGQPKALNITEDSIELEWNIPERPGASPIVGYLLQYFSPDVGESWQNIHDGILKHKFRVKHLKPGYAYVFVVRAENAKGIGMPSPVSELMRTRMSPPVFDEPQQAHLMTLDIDSIRQKLVSEQLIKLKEVNSVNSTAMQLVWKRQRKEALVQGYYIKWRGPPLTPEHSWVNVTDPDSEVVVINGLRPYTNYEFFIIPYHGTVQGMPSNSLSGTTSESMPTMPPSDVRIRMLNITSLRVSWRPPLSEGINGVLKGFLINIRTNQSATEDRNITTNERATSVTLYRLVPDASYTIRVAARTVIGIGVFFDGDPVIMNEETLRQHIKQYEKNVSDSWLRQPWTVLAIGIVIWCILLLLVTLLWFRCCHRKEKLTSKSCDFIKIRDGSVSVLNNSNARTVYWPNTENYNGAAATGTVETFTGTSAVVNSCNQVLDHPTGLTDNYHQQERYSVGYDGCNVPPNFCPVTGQFFHPTSCSTLQRGSCSPSHHYHYAALPDYCQQQGQQMYAVNTFQRRNRQPEYYDDPSPYATTTLVVNTEGSKTPNTVCSASRTDQNIKNNAHGPALPVNPIPREPPRSFFCNARGSRNLLNNLDCQSNCHGSNNNVFYRPCCYYHLHGHSHASCGDLVPNNRAKCHITANSRYPHSPSAITSRTLIPSKNPHPCHNQLYDANCTRDHPYRHSTASRKQPRSSSVNAENTRSIRNNKVTASARYGHCNSSRRPSSNQITGNGKNESPQTDVSYIQSSDGTGSSKGKCPSDNFEQPQPNCYSQEQEVTYDDVPISINTRQKQNNFEIDVVRRQNRRSVKRVNKQFNNNNRRQNSRTNRLSLIERDEHCEDDPLMDCMDADSEFSEQSEDYCESARRAISDENVEKRRSAPTQTIIEFEPYSVAKQAGRLRQPQPFMGVNISSTLSPNSNENSAVANRRSTPRIST